MSQKILFSLVESHRFPKLTLLANELGYQEIIVDSSRKALLQLKKNPPSAIIAEYRYSFSNNYSGIATSNLDIFLRSLPKFAPHAVVIILAAEDEIEYTGNLSSIYPLRIMPINTPAKTLIDML
jgi:hypothetical protein